MRLQSLVVWEKNCWHWHPYNELTWHKNEQVEPVQLVQMNVYQIPIEDLRWQYFKDELRVQEKKQVKDQQSYKKTS